MQIDKIINTIKSESSGFYLLEITNSESISYLEEQILNNFYEKQYEIDTSFIILEPEEKSKFITIDQVRKMKNICVNEDWRFLKNYKNNISNLNLNINLYYKFANKIPKSYSWYSINSNKELIPSFTKKIFKQVSTLF